MKHRVGYNRLGRKASHRRAMMRNLATSLFRHERIRTTKARARELRRYAEKMITRAKVDSVHNRRIIAADIGDKAVLAKLFTDIGPRFANRPGGYTRILKIGFRQGDAAEMVIIELVDGEPSSDQGESKKRRSRQSESSPAKTKTAKSPAQTEESTEATEAATAIAEPPAPAADGETSETAAAEESEQKD